MTAALHEKRSAQGIRQSRLSTANSLFAAEQCVAAQLLDVVLL